MKRILLTVWVSALIFLISVPAWAGSEKSNKNKPKSNVSCKSSPKSAFTRKELPPRGGRTELAQGIEGRKINWGFDLGGSLALMDALNREKATIGGRGTIFIHAIIPNTKTFAIGFEGGATYLLANQQKFKETLIASSRDGALASTKEPEVKVADWLLPTAQLSFMGNFHPVQRFNVQIKGNIGAVLAMVPRYEASYFAKEIQSDGQYVESNKRFVYDNDMAIGTSVTIGTKLLYAITAHTEFGVGLDWTYMRFSYEKGWLSPVPKISRELTQFGIFNLHVGFAFSF